MSHVIEVSPPGLFPSVLVPGPTGFILNPIAQVDFTVRYEGGPLHGQTKTYHNRVPAREIAHHIPGPPLPKEVLKEYVRNPHKYPFVERHIYELQKGLPATFRHVGQK